MMMEKPGQAVQPSALHAAKRSRNIRLAVVFGVIAVGWYAVAMWVIWTQ